MYVGEKYEMEVSSNEMRVRRNGLIGLAIAVVAGAGLIPSPVSAADPGPHSITACTISDGSSTNSIWTLTPDEAVTPGSVPQLTMVPTPLSGKKLYSDNGYRNKTTNVFVSMGSGTGPAEGAGYQPPTDVPYWVVSQRFNESNTDYPASDWVYEFRYWATQGDDTNSQSSDTTGSPLCKITVSVTTAGDNGSDGGFDVDVDLDHYLRRSAGDSALPDTL